MVFLVIPTTYLNLHLEYKHTQKFKFIEKKMKKGLIKNLFEMRQETCSEPQINK